MEIKDIQEFLEANKENNEVIDFMKSIQQPLTRDIVEAWCQDGEGRSWLDRNCDIYSNKAVKTAKENAIAKFKEEELPNLINEAIKSKSEEGLTPEQIKLKELEKQLADMQSEKAHNELIKQNEVKLKENGLTGDLAKYVNSDEDITFFKNLITNCVESGVKERLNNSSYVPPKTEVNNSGKITWQQVIENPTLMSEYNNQK